MPKKANALPKPQIFQCLPLPFSWHQGGLLRAGSDHPGASAENSDPGSCPPRGICPGRSGSRPCPRCSHGWSRVAQSPLKGHLLQEAFSGHQGERGGALPGVPPDHGSFGARLLATSPHPRGSLLQGSRGSSYRAPPSGRQPAALWGWDVVGLGAPLSPARRAEGRGARGGVGMDA